MGADAGAVTTAVNFRVDPALVREELAARDGRSRGNTAELGAAARARNRQQAHRVGAEAATDRFVRLVIPHLRDAYTLARWITGNRIDAEDVVQEACLRAFRVMSSAGDFNARAWTRGAVRSAGFAWLRKFRPAAQLPPDEFGPVEHERLRAWDSDGMTPEAALIAKTDAARLEAAIAGMPAPFREALALRVVQGLSYREIADLTGVPIGTVMSRLARGRTRLVKLMSRRPPDAHAGGVAPRATA
jgi:RNA polymerase sigma-70 factor (ECF subfamily)